MILSTGCTYGLQALLYLDSLETQGFTSVGRIAEEWNLSPSFLSKIMRRLVSAGLLISTKGPGGGVRLARSSREINMLQVAQAIDGVKFRQECILFPTCDQTEPCPVHEAWEPFREEIIGMLASKTLRDIAGQWKLPAHRKSRAGRGARQTPDAQ